MSTKGGTNRPGGRSKPAKYSGARVYGTLGGYTKALEWHAKGPAPDEPDHVVRGRARSTKKRPPSGGQCQAERTIGGVTGVCGLPINHSNHKQSPLFYRRWGGEGTPYHTFKASPVPEGTT